MGYLRNECIVVSSWDHNSVHKAHSVAAHVFNAKGLGTLVGAIAPHAINGGAAFLIAPDGSKEGWEVSDTAAAARSEFIAALGTLQFVEWALILIGGDDGEYKVLASPAEAEAA